MPQLAGRGRSFFSSSQAAVRTLGELVAKNAVDDPQLVDDPQAPGVLVCNCLSVVFFQEHDYFTLLFFVNYESSS